MSGAYASGFGDLETKCPCGLGARNPRLRSPRLLFYLQGCREYAAPRRFKLNSSGKATRSQEGKECRQDARGSRDARHRNTRRKKAQDASEWMQRTAPSQAGATCPKKSACSSPRSPVLLVSVSARPPTLSPAPLSPPQARTSQLMIKQVSAFDAYDKNDAMREEITVMRVQV